MYDEMRDNGLDVMVVNTVKMQKPAVKTDRRDAHRMAHLLRLYELPSAYIPYKETRKQRELCKLRVRLVQSCTQCKNRISAILHKEGKRPIGVKDVFSKKGLAQLREINISRKEELSEELELLELLWKKVDRIEKQIDQVIASDFALNKRVKLINTR